MRFTAGKESSEKCIDLPEDDPEMIRRLIAYLYLGDYDPCDGARLAAIEDITQHESTTAAATFYHARYRTGSLFSGGPAASASCACLALAAKEARQPVREPEPKDQPANYTLVPKPASGIEVANPLTIHATMYALADKYQVDGLSSLAKEKFYSCLHHHVNSEDFVAAVQIAYGATPESNRGLRDMVVKAFLTHFKVDVTKIPGFEAKLESIDELSFLLIKAWPVKTEVPNTTEVVSLFGRPPPSASTLPITRGTFAGAFGGPA